MIPFSGATGYVQKSQRGHGSMPVPPKRATGRDVRMLGFAVYMDGYIATVHIPECLLFNEEVWCTMF